MTTIQRTARIFGWVFVVVAIWGAAVTGTSMEADPAVAPRLWGLFPINFIHNLVHLVFGIWGIRAARSVPTARTYALGAGTAYLVLALLGAFFPSGFGLVPIGGNDIWLHVLLGAALLGTGMAFGRAVAGPAVETSGTRTVPPSTTASSRRAAVTRSPAQPSGAEAHDPPVPPGTAGSAGPAGSEEGASRPEPPENVVDEPPRQPDDEERPRGA